MLPSDCSGLAATSIFRPTIGDYELGQRIIDYVKVSGAQLVPDSADATRTLIAVVTVSDDRSATDTFGLEWELSCTPPATPPLFCVHRIYRRRTRAGLLGSRGPCPDAYQLSATVSFDPNVLLSPIVNQDLSRECIEHCVERSD